LVVKDFNELEERKAEAKGKIVLFNAEFTSYGKTVQYRYSGASEAAKVGAVASLIRSVGPYSMDTPHTGVMKYEDGVRKIPHAAITVEDAMMLQRMQDRGQKIVVKLKMSAKMFPDAKSRNVIAEIRGSEKPEEIVVIGGHIDSWDVGQGAMDDAGGCMVAWDALNVIQSLGLKPKRTIRCVLWTNEENGLGGGKAYRDAHLDELPNHILAVESDGGVFAPEGFGFTGSPKALEIIREIGTLLEPIGAGTIKVGGGGADIGPMKPFGVPQAGLHVEGSKYFWFHHTNADMMDKLDPQEVNKCKAAMAVLAFIVADMPERLPRVKKE
jgi:carboxypeptidase Q